MGTRHQRRVVRASDCDGSVHVEIDTNNKALTHNEAVQQADDIASAIMKVLAEQTRYLSVPLSRVIAQRRRK